MTSSLLLSDLISVIESWAPPVYQESYDNVGLLIGDRTTLINRALITLDCTEEVMDEAIERGCQLIIAHHPVIFKGLKKITGQTDVERTIMKAIQHRVAIYALHTNLDNISTGVNAEMAKRIGLIDTRVLSPRQGTLLKLYTYVPISHLDVVRDALFAAGAGKIGHYDEAGFFVMGKGTFRATEQANPFLGEVGIREEVEEARLEVLVPDYLSGAVVRALFAAHPYEEVAYEIIQLENERQDVGSGLWGILPEPEEEQIFFQRVKDAFGCKVIRHSRFLGKKVQKVALCGGAGSFLIPRALATGADVYLTADLKYHEFFQAEGRLVLADLGHFESEQYTSERIFDHISKKIPTFALLLSKTITNPVKYL